MEKFKKIDLMKIILFLAPILIGCFSLWSNFLLAIIFIIGIIVKVKRNNKIILPKGMNLLLICIYIFSFIVVEFYAVDKGMNLLGFFKNFTIILFIFLYLQYKYDEASKNELINIIPYSALFSLIISILFIWIEEVFFENRFQGIFMYANAYALFLLLGIIILLMKSKIRKRDLVVAILLFIGIVFTNSRAVIILSILSCLICILINSQNRKKLLCIIMSLLIILGVIYAFSDLDKRINTDMFQSGEVSLRTIYYKDGLKMILENPFGYGYMGYMYKQAEIQSTIYDTMFVHSSLIQIALDVGIIPLISLIILIAKVFFDKKQSKLSRLLLILIVGHSIIDIDLEYMIFIYLICLMINFETIEIKNKRINVASILLGVLYIDLFFGAVSFACKNYETAYNFIPYYTKAMEEELYKTTEYDKQIEMAKRIYPLNKNISGMYEALSNEERKNKNYDKALEYEKKRLKLNKFFLEDYLIYLEFLLEATEYNKAQNNKEDILKYEQEIIKLEKLIEEATKDTTVKIELPIEIKEYIDNIKNRININE